MSTYEDTGTQEDSIMSDTRNKLNQKTKTKTHLIKIKVFLFFIGIIHYRICASPFLEYLKGGI